MKGTTPLSRLTQSFRDRLRAVDRKLMDEPYAGESYDAVVISALAAQIARTHRPEGDREQINGVTSAAPTATARDLPAPGRRPATTSRTAGITLGLGGFTDAGEPSAGTYGILRFAPPTTSTTARRSTSRPATANQATEQRPPAPDAAAGTRRRCGSARCCRTPATWPPPGPPMFAGAQLARAGDQRGRWCARRRWRGSTATTAPTRPRPKATAQRLINERGRPGDHRRRRLVDLQGGPAHHPAPPAWSCSRPATRRPSSPRVADKGLYFRTAPPDDLQAAALTDIIMRDGVRRGGDRRPRRRVRTRPDGRGAEEPGRGRPRPPAT